MKIRLNGLSVTVIIACGILIAFYQSHIFESIFPNCDRHTIKQEDLTRINCFKSFFSLR